MKEPKFEMTMNEYLPLREVVFNTLRQAILRGELKPGERLMEIQLAKALGVSRTPIREAMRKLEHEGLVTMTPRKGAEVADISEKSLRDVLEVREALETLSVELACDNITGKQLKELKAAAKKFQDVQASKDVTKIAEADEAFHDIINLATGNQRLISMLSNLREQMYRYRVEYLKNEDTYGQLVEEHERLMKAIADKDKELASEILCRHIENQVAAISDQIRSKQKTGRTANL